MHTPKEQNKFKTQNCEQRYFPLWGAKGLGFDIERDTALQIRREYQNVPFKTLQDIVREYESVKGLQRIWRRICEEWVPSESNTRWHTYAYAYNRLLGRIDRIENMPISAYSKRDCSI